MTFCTTRGVDITFVLSIGIYGCQVYVLKETYDGDSALVVTKQQHHCELMLAVEPVVVPVRDGRRTVTQARDSRQLAGNKISHDRLSSTVVRLNTVMLKHSTYMLQLLHQQNDLYEKHHITCRQQ